MRVLPVVAMLLLPFVLASCSLPIPGSGASETITQQFSVGSNPTVVVQSDGGGISVTSGADGTVKITAEKHAGSSDALKQMQVSMTGRGDEVRASYQRGGDFRQRYVDFTITAPKSTRLQLQTGGGAVGVDGIANTVAARTGGGSITVKNQQGAVSADSGGGSIAITGSLTGENTARTGGGSITVTLPANSNLRVNAMTAGGTISTDFGLPVSGVGSQSAAGTIGDGSQGTLTLRSGGGSIAIRKQ